MNGGPGKKKDHVDKLVKRSFKDRVVKIIQTISLVLIPFSPGVLFIIIWLLIYISF